MNPLFKKIGHKLEKNYLIISGKNPARLAEIWEGEYSQGRWSYLKESGETARFGILAACIRHFKPGGSLLDVGCGEGVLLDYLAPGSFSRYLGIDMAGGALQKPTPGPAPELTGFAKADAESYRPGENFDLVIFNEVIYYFSHPLNTLANYCRHLNPEGLLLVSMYDSLRNRALWRAILHRYQVVDGYRLKNQAGVSWQIRVLKPGR